MFCEQEIYILCNGTERPQNRGDYDDWVVTGDGKYQTCCIFIGHPAGYISIRLCIYGCSCRYILCDQMIRNISGPPVLALIFYPNAAYQGHFIVLVSKLRKFFHEKQYGTEMLSL